MGKIRKILAEEGLTAHAPRKASLGGKWLDLQMYDDHERNLEDLVEALQGDWVRVMVSLGGYARAEISTEMSLEEIEADPKAQAAIKHMKRSFGASSPERGSGGMITISFGG